ncbi:hypothetical protein B0H21DRAFT_706158 [Amylocystis lapponica]|nr:hypothetical protein B0H21DRAFT_706158 [Amylocystis lapponica]
MTLFSLLLPTTLCLCLCSVGGVAVEVLERSLLLKALYSIVIILLSLYFPAFETLTVSFSNLQLESLALPLARVVNFGNNLQATIQTYTANNTLLALKDAIISMYSTTSNSVEKVQAGLYDIIISASNNMS